MEVQTATTQRFASAAESADAGEAVSAALAALAAPASIAIAFVSGDGDPAGTARAIADGAGDTPAVGLTGAGLIGPSGPAAEGCAALALGEGVQASASRVEKASSDLREAGRRAAREALESNGAEPDVLLLFVDSSHGDIAETIAGAYEVAGPRVRLAGGAAGGTHRCHFMEGEATTDSVVAVALASTNPIGVGLAQSCRVGSSPALVTRSDGQTVKEINGVPAEQAYGQALGLRSEELSDEEFRKIAITHPLAQLELHGDPRLRHVLGRDGRGGLVVGSHIAASSPIEFVDLAEHQLLASARESVAGARAALAGEDPSAAMVFDCAGRRQVMQGRLGAEQEAIREELGTPALAGTYTNGEVARIKGAIGDRNHAVVTVAFA